MAGATFTYVRIPASDDDPLEELLATADICGDTLKDLLRKAFAGGELTNFGELEAQYGALASQHRLGFERAARTGSVEVLPILRQSPTTTPPNTATFLYYDEMGALKERPDNRRARELALQCGLALEHPLPGDVYVGRVCCDPGPVSVSICKGDWAWTPPGSGRPRPRTRSGREPCRSSTAPRRRRPSARRPRTGGKKARRGWRWAQTGEEVEVTVGVPEGTAKGDVRVDIGSASLRVALRGEPAAALADLRLYAGVLPEESTWTLLSDQRGRHVQATVAEKQERVHEEGHRRRAEGGSGARQAVPERLGVLVGAPEAF
ncbi:unnamed protein product [Prorocentrum cordatum]|uniref:CS domain-containing protein n=1 Tax=Prorocentrum cordatum TaxID=2364126 RepID=A0ABN9UND0_9DINO|nr:unnamed protein product [Polarella glacialis]